jgi:hypothetical protein
VKNPASKLFQKSLAGSYKRRQGNVVRFKEKRYSASEYVQSAAFFPQPKAALDEIREAVVNVDGSRFLREESKNSIL